MKTKPKSLGVSRKKLSPKKKSRTAAKKKRTKPKTAKKRPTVKKIKKASPKKTIKKATSSRSDKKKTAPKKPLERKPSGELIPEKPPVAPALMETMKIEKVADQLVGKMIHFYNHSSIGIVQVENGTLRIGDIIHIKGHTTDFEQAVESMQIEHQNIETAIPGQIIGLKVNHTVRENDRVYKKTTL